MLTKNNWLSYLHTNIAKMLQKCQYKSHPKKKELNAQALLKYTTFISIFSEKKLVSATIFSLWYKCLNFIDIIDNANYCNDTWKTLPSKKSQKRKSVMRKSTKNRKENVEISNNQEMSLQYTYISEGNHCGNSLRLGKWTQVKMVENVHSTRFKREFCKPASKSDSRTTPEKGLV